MKKILLLLFVLTTSKLFAQVNLQTGSANYSIPMFNWNDDKSKLNGVVALNYNSGNGLKVSDAASNVGQGWNLIVGGVITRMQVGEPDDQSEYKGIKYSGTGIPKDEDITRYPAGYLYASIPDSAGCPNALTTYPIYGGKNVMYAQHNITAEDKQMDRFAFQFNGKSGIFVLDKTHPGNGFFIGDTKMKVTYQTDFSMITNTTSGIRTTITSFTIQDVDGLIYKFTLHGLTKVLHLGYCGADLSTEQAQPSFKQGGIYHQSGFDQGQTSVQIINPFIINSWYLSEIDDPLTHRSVIFNYNSPVTATNFAGLDISNSRTSDKSYIIIDHKKSVTVIPHLSSIVYPDGHQVNINYGSPRVDMNGENVIASIDILYNARYLSEYQLNTTYFILNRYGTPTSTYQKSCARLCLKSVKKLGVDLKEDTPPYLFDYYLGSDASDDFVPPPFFYAHDIFGFYNGNYSIDYNGNQIPLLNTDISKLNFDQLRGLVYITSYNDNPNSINNIPAYINSKPGYAKNGLLKQIIYPTGGTLFYNYTQNKGSIPNNVVYNSASVGYIGGVNVSQTNSTDGGYSNGCGNPIITNYNYVLSDGHTSSIWGIEPPANKISFTTHYAAERWELKWWGPIPKGCDWEFKYPGIQSQYEFVSLTDLQNLMVGLSNVLNIVSAITTITDILSIVTWSTVIVGPIGAIIDLIVMIGSIVWSCTSKDDHATDTNMTIYYNTDLNGAAPLPVQFKRVEVVESGGDIGKTVQEFTSEDDYPVWVPANANPDLSSKQRFAQWAYGLPKTTSVYDVNGNLIKQTKNVYDTTKASNLIGCPTGNVPAQTITLPTSNVNGVCYSNIPNTAYGIYGPYIYSSVTDNTGTWFADNTTGFWDNIVGNTTDGRINRIGIWPCNGVPDNTWTGFTVQVFFPSSQTYYFGMGGDNQVRISLDSNLIKELDINTLSSADPSMPFRRWNIYPYYVSQGYHSIKVEGYNESGVALYGAEIYNATASQLQILDSNSIKALTLFSTGDILKGKNFTQGYGCPEHSTLNFSGGSFYCTAPPCPIYATDLRSQLLSCKCEVNLSSSLRNEYWSDTSRYYTPSSTTYTNASNSAMGVDIFGYYTGRIELDSTYERVFNLSDASKYTETVTAYQYNNGSTNYDVNQITTVQSNGNTNYKQIKYNSDFLNTGTVLDNLYNNNIFSVPVSTYTTVTPKNSSNLSLLNENVTEFTQSTNGDIKPYRTLEQRFAQPANAYSLYQGPGNANNPSYKQTQKLTYDANSNLIGMQDEGNHVVTNIYDYNDKYVVASAINADPVADHCAYTSFENTVGGGWTLNGVNTIGSASAITGSKDFVLLSGGGNSLSAGPINTTKSYIVSFWATSGGATVSNGTLVKSSPTINGFTYYEYNIPQGNSSVTISCTANTTIDELRLYPQDARMRTITYDPLIGKTSECDENNRITYYEYDNLGRLRFVKDENKQVVKMYEYNNVSAAKQNGCPTTYYNHAITEYYTKSNCGNGYVGTDVAYTVPAAKYSSTKSQQDADVQAELELLTNGQTNANSNGGCQLIYYNQVMSVTDTVEICPIGWVGGTVTYTVPAGRYSSLISQAAADSMAVDDINANAKAYANNFVDNACIITTDPIWEADANAQTQCMNGYIYFLATDVNPNSPTYNTTSWQNSGEVGSCCTTQSTPGIYNGVCYGNYSNSAYGIYGPYIYSSVADNTGTWFADNTTGFWENIVGNTTEGRLNRIGIWPCSGAPNNAWIGLTVPVFFPTSGTYYFGMGADNQVRVSLDNTLIKEIDMYTLSSVDPSMPFRRWNIYPYYVTQGYHNVKIEGYNDGAGPALFAAEVYNATAQQLQTLDSNSIKAVTLFSTGDILKGGICLSSNYSPLKFKGLPKADLMSPGYFLTMKKKNDVKRKFIKETKKIDQRKIIGFNYRGITQQDLNSSNYLQNVRYDNGNAAD